MANTIGIDFGTTKTMVSYFNPATGLVDLVSLGRCGRASIPTTVHVDEFGAFLFGDDADDQIEMDPEGYCRAFKLHLGEDDPVLFRADGTETAESLATHFLRHVKKECEQSVPVFHGEPVTSATITIPVAFSPARKASLKRAAEAAGFSSVSFLAEPEAAGTAFLRDNPADKFSHALVLDWGGGTLDIAIISRDEDGSIHADHHCVEGRDDMGGEEMDRGLFENLKIMWKNTYGSPLLESEENEPKLLRKSEQVKIALSNKEVVPFYLRRKKIDVTRDKFRRIVEDCLQVSVDLVQSALSKNKAQGRPEPDAIILIGGMSQSPVVREAMERNFPKLRVLSWHRSHEAVALGATSFPKNVRVKRKTSENSNCAVMVVDKNDSNESFCLTDEAIRLLARQCVVNGRRSRAKRRFVEERFPDVVGNPAWTHRVRTSEDVETLALATVDSYHNESACLSFFTEALKALSTCSGSPTEEERYALAMIKYCFGFRKTRPRCSAEIVSWDDAVGTDSVPDDSWGVGTGAAVGAAIGTVIPGVGTVVGASIGAGIGLFKKICGK